MNLTLNDYTEKFNYKYINDAIYGSVGLSNLEVDIINTPIFQRLRKIRQLGFVNYVFPGAEHSRFVHSIGVLYIMGEITNHLLSNEYINIRDVIKLRMAALLHDIGHYPFSHLVEYVFMHLENEKLDYEDMFNKNNTTGEIIYNAKGRTSLLSRLAQKPDNDETNHENLSKQIIINNNDISSILRGVNISPEEIGSIITGEIGTENMLYSQLMHSNIDADRLDYLLRDSTRTGVNYGIIDLKYIIRLMKVVKNYEVKVEDEESKLNILVLKNKGQHVIEHYLMSRYFHYSQVIGHKTGLAFEMVAKACIYKLLKAEGFIFNSYEEIIENLNNNEDFLHFHDESLLNALNEYYKFTTDQDYKKYYEAIRDRKRPKTLIEKRDLVNKSENSCFDKEYHNLKEKLMEKPEIISDLLGISSELVGFQEFKTEIGSISSHTDLEKTHEITEENLREAIRLIDENGQVYLLALDKNSLVNKITDLVNKIIRVIYIEDDNWEEPEEKWKEARDKLEKIIKSDGVKNG